jgi:hypothetical protein
MPYWYHYIYNKILFGDMELSAFLIIMVLVALIVQVNLLKSQGLYFQNYKEVETIY